MFKVRNAVCVCGDKVTVAVNESAAGGSKDLKN